MCPICLTDDNTEELSFYCGHTFHVECIRPMFTMCMLCPLCRRHVFASDIVLRYGDEMVYLVIRVNETTIHYSDGRSVAVAKSKVADNIIAVHGKDTIAEFRHANTLLFSAHIRKFKDFIAYIHVHNYETSRNLRKYRQSLEKETFITPGGVMINPALSFDALLILLSP